MTEYYKAYVRIVGQTLLVAVHKRAPPRLILSTTSSASDPANKLVFECGSVVVMRIDSSTQHISKTIGGALREKAQLVLQETLGKSEVDKEILIKALVSLREAQDVYEQESLQSKS